MDMLLGLDMLKRHQVSSVTFTSFSGVFHTCVGIEYMICHWTTLL